MTMYELSSLYSPAAGPSKGLKRGWEEDGAGLGCRATDQTVPLSPPKRPRTDLPFSNLLRSMSAKYAAPPPSPALPLIMSLLAPPNNPYSKLMQTLASLSRPDSAPDSQQLADTPLDLSGGSDKEEVEEVDVVGEEEEEIVERWSPSRVSRWLETAVPGCEEYGPLLAGEGVGGALLLRLTVPQLVAHLGLPLGHAVRLVSAVRRLKQ